MTKRALHYPEGTKTVGTARVSEEPRIAGYAQRQLMRQTGVQPNSEFDEIAAGSGPVVSLAPPARPRAVDFTVEGNPVAKGRPRAARTASGVRMHTPAKTSAYERKVKGVAIIAMAGGKPFTRPVSLHASIFVPVPASWSMKKKLRAIAGEICATKKPDADNFLKAIKDAMNGVVYRDDAQVVMVDLTKKYGDKPRIDVAVIELDRESA